MPGIELFRLDGRVALITGGSKGLGYNMASGLLSAGADVAICSRHGEEADQAASQLSNECGRPVRAYECDVSNEAEVENLVSQTIGDLGKIDILIANAGINIRGEIDKLTPGEFQEVMNVNVTGVWLCCRAVVPHMKKAKYGRIIALGSVLSAVGVAYRTPYASSKGAVAIMAKTLALEWAGDGITVNALCPGPFLTPMNIPIADKEETKKFIVGAVPLARWAELHEIEGAAIFLASDASSYVTGTTLFVDGGWTAH